MNKVIVSSSVSRGYAPDVANFNIHISRVEENSPALIDYNKDIIARLVEAIGNLGIEEDNFKELYFRIGINRVYEDNKYIDKGFKLESGYSISVYIDYELMDSIREMLTDLDLAFSIDYSLEDESEIRDSLLSEAVEKSKKKAQVIAMAGGCAVGDMLEVRYGDSDAKPMLLRANAPRDNMDAAPHDIDITESVEVEWELV